jgi:hypothetical protein
MWKPGTNREDEEGCTCTTKRTCWACAELMSAEVQALGLPTRRAEVAEMFRRTDEHRAGLAA